MKVKYYTDDGYCRSTLEQLTRRHAIGMLWGFSIFSGFGIAFAFHEFANIEQREAERAE